MKVDVLGTKYKIIKHNKDNPIRIDGCDGYCDYTVKEIHIAEMEDYEWADVEAHANKVIRHELVHAFLYEGGLNSESWARNEEIVDWMAIQIPKIANKFNKLNI